MSAEVAPPVAAEAETVAASATDPNPEEPVMEEVETETTITTEEVEAEGEVEFAEADPEPEGPYEWPLKDQLVLMSTIVVSREDWSIVDDQMQQYAEAVVEMEEEDDEEIWRPEDWWTHDSCVNEYHRMLETYKAEKEQQSEPQPGPSSEMQTTSTAAAVATTATTTASESETSLAIAEVILRKLEEEREIELEEEIRKGVLEYKSGLEDIQRMEAADYGHIMEIVAGNEAFRRFMVEEGMEEQWEDGMDDYEEWLKLSPEEREAATIEARVRALAEDAEEELEVDVEEGLGTTTMGPPPPAGGGPSSPKVSPQLKNLVYTKIAGTTEEDVGNLPAPASSPTLSMLLEMPPRGHGQPLPEIPTVSQAQAPQQQKRVEAGPSSAAAATEAVVESAEALAQPAKGTILAELPEGVMEVDVEIKIEGEVAAAVAAKSEKIDQIPSGGREQSTPIKTEPEDAGEGKTAEGAISDSETTITGSITPPSQRGPGSVPTTPVGVGTGGTSPSVAAAAAAAGGRVTRRHAGLPEAASGVEEGKSLRGRTIVTTPTKEDKDMPTAVAAKEKVRVKLEFDASNRTLKKPAAVDFKTVAIKEKEGETTAGRDLRSRRSGAPTAGTGTATAKPTPASTHASAAGSKTPKKDTSDEEEFLDSRPDVSLGPEATPGGGAGADELEAHARATATERWVEGAGTTTAAPPKPVAAVTGAEATVKKRRGDSSEERVTASDKEKEKNGEEKRVTRARTRTTPGAAPAAAAATPAQTTKTTTTMTPPATPTLALTSAVHAHAKEGQVQARSTPEPEAGGATPTATTASRALRSRQRLPDSFSFGGASGVEPSSPAPYSQSTPHSPASSTATSSAMFEETSSSFSAGLSSAYTSTEDKNMKRALLSLHRLVTNLKHAYIFLKNTIPKYSRQNFDKFILRPLDFSVIKRGIESDSIRSFDAYQLQVSIMFMNHLMYFNEDLDLHNQTKQMALETFDIIEDFVRNYNESNAPRGSASASGGAAKREGRHRDLRHSYSTTSSGAAAAGAGTRKGSGTAVGTPTPSVADSGARDSRGGNASGSEESHDEGGRVGGGGGASASGGPGSGQGTGTGRGRGRRKRVELSPSITDEPRKGPGRTPRGPGVSGTSAAKTRHSAM